MPYQTIRVVDTTGWWYTREVGETSRSPMLPLRCLALYPPPQGPLAPSVLARVEHFCLLDRAASPLGPPGSVAYRQHTRIARLRWRLSARAIWIARPSYGPSPAVRLEDAIRSRPCVQQSSPCRPLKLGYCCQYSTPQRPSRSTGTRRYRRGPRLPHER